MLDNISQLVWKKKIILFLTGQSITLFGSTLVQMAIVWYVTRVTSSGTWIAAFTAASYLPQFLISFVGGVWADRHSRKALIIGADALIAAITLLMIFLMPYIKDEQLLLSGLLVMSVLRSFGAGVQTPAVNAVIPQLVPEENLMRYNGINSIMQSAVQFAAPAAAGVLLSFTTLREALLVDVVTAALGIGLLYTLILPKQEASPEKQSVFYDMKIGLKYTFSNPLLRKLLLVFYGLFIFLSVPAGFLAQLYVNRTYGETYWYLTAVELVGFFGMMGGGIIMSTWGGFKSRMRTLTLGLGAFGALAIGMGLSKSFILYLAFMLLYGIALTMVQTATTTIVQEKAKPSMQGRVFGLLSSMYSGFLPIGMAIFGPMSDMIPLQFIIIGSGAALLFVSAFAKRSEKDENITECEQTD